MAKIVSFSLEEGGNYYGRIDGQRFFIGSRARYTDEKGNQFKGLMNTKGTAAHKYDRAAFRDAHGFWADFLHPTSMAEGALFHTLNTYDRAQFTFSFMQYAAHVPNGDFVQYFRALLQLPLATEYFPDLRVENGRIVRYTENGKVVLETKDSTKELMDYLNPTIKQVEDVEVIQAAKFVHWSQNDPLHRQLQVDLAVSHFKEQLRAYAKTYSLDGVSDRICLVIADIHHQGRAKEAAVKAALAQSDPLAALLRLKGKNDKFASRVATIEREMNKLTNEGTLGTRVYSLTKRDFVTA